MINFIKANSTLSLTLLVSILFFLRKGIQYSAIGSHVPLFIIVGVISLLAISLRAGKSYFIILLKTWSVALIIWSLVRIVISTVHLTLQPFDGSNHLTQQFSIYALIISILMLVLSIAMFRSSNKKKLKGVARRQK